MRKRTPVILFVLCMLVSLVTISAAASDRAEIEVKTAEEFATALNSASPVSSITINGDFAIARDYMVHFTDGKLANYRTVTLSVAAGKTLTIEEGGSFGIAWYEYDFDNDPGPSPSARIINNGTILVKSGGSYTISDDTNNGFLTIEEDGVAMGGLENNGTVTVEKGGLLACGMGNSNIVNEDGGLLKIQAGGTLVSWMGSRIRNLSGATLTLDGDLILGGAIDEQNPSNENLWFENLGTVTHTGATNTGKVFEWYGASDEVKASLKTLFGVSTIYYGAPVYSAQELYEAAAKEGAIFSRISTVRIMKNMTIARNRTVRAGFQKLIVSDGVTLTLNTNSMLGAEMEICSGGAVTVKSGATLSTAQGCRFRNSGTITVNTGGTLISQMGSTIENLSGGRIAVNGTFNISDPENWEMMGCFEDRGGAITGSGLVNIANCSLSVKTDSHTFDDFTGTVKYYAASVTTTKSLKKALTESSADKPYIFLTNTSKNGPEYSFVISDPIEIKDRELIVMYDTEGNYRNIDFTDDGSLTLINTNFTRWMRGLDGSICLNLNGGTLKNWTPYDDLEKITSKTKLLLPTPEKSGYRFTGWKVTRDDEPAAIVSAGKYSLTETGNYTFTARYTRTYTVTFNKNGHGTAPASQTVDSGKTATKPTNPGTTGYTFGGWYKDKALTTKYDFSTAVKSDLTLYAKWTANSYQIAFHANGGKGTMKSISATYGSGVKLTANAFTKSGYVFNGWNTKKDGSGKSYSDKVSVRNLSSKAGATVTLYAQWVKAYTIKFNGNGATSGSMSSITATYGSGIKLTANAYKKSGYVFNGWNTKKDGSGTSYANKASVKNLSSKAGGTVTLYAQWKKK